MGDSTRRVPAGRPYIPKLEHWSSRDTKTMRLRKWFVDEIADGLDPDG